jgi:hypothetical protein
VFLKPEMFLICPQVFLSCKQSGEELYDFSVLVLSDRPAKVAPKISSKLHCIIFALFKVISDFVDFVYAVFFIVYSVLGAHNNLN